MSRDIDHLRSDDGHSQSVSQSNFTYRLGPSGRVGRLKIYWVPLCSEKYLGYWPSCGRGVMVSQSIRQKMFYICCCLHAHYYVLFSDLWPVYTTLIGKLMLRKVLISLWHQFIGHDMTCEVCDSKHLCSFHFVFSALLIYFDFSRSWFRFKTPICLQGINSTSPITRHNQS